MDRGLLIERVRERALEEITKNKSFIKVIVLYHGGEPLLYSGFYDLVADIRTISHDFFIKTVSNGMALNRLNARKIIDSGINAIEISLDGNSPSESDKIRKNSKAEKIIQNVLNLIDLRDALGSSTLHVSIATTQFISPLQIQKNLLKPPEAPEWLRQIFGVRVEYKSTWAIKWPHSKETDYEHVTGSPLNENGYCDHVLNTITVRADGSVVACCYDLTSQLVMGNILENPIKDIWHGQRYEKLRQSLREKKYQSICNGCATVTPPVYLIPKWRSSQAIPISIA